MRLAAAVAVAAATLAAATSAVATAGALAVEVHFLSRVGVGAIGWWAYGPLSLFALAAGIRILTALPFSTWGVWTVAVAKVADALRDVWLVGPYLWEAEVVVPSATLLAIVGAGAVSTYVAARPGRPAASRFDPTRRAVAANRRTGDDAPDDPDRVGRSASGTFLGEWFF